VTAGDFGLLVLAGFVSSVINVLAAGGSFLTLPVLIFLGLPAADANATNRVGVVAQNLAAVWGFHRREVLDRGWALASAVPAVAGSVLGAWFSLTLDDGHFRRLLAVVMLAAALWTLVDPMRRVTPRPPRAARSPLVVFGFLFVGFYGGLMQAGVGFLVIGVTTLAGIDVLRGSAIKVFTILFVTLVALALFAWTGHVRWAAGIALAAGSLVGGLAGVPIALKLGQKWLERVVAGAIVVFAFALWFS
jgi:uncharacterized membrane protein YfcA